MESIQTTYRSIGVLLLSTFLVVAITSVLVLATDFILLIFLAILFGVFLTKTSRLIGKLVPLSYGSNLAIVVTPLLALIIGVTLVFGVKIENRLENMSENLDHSAEKLDEWLDQHSVAKTAFNKIPFANELLRNRVESEQEADGFKTSGETSATPNDERPDRQDKNPDETTQTGGDSANASAQVNGDVAGRVFPVFGRMMGTTLGMIANLSVIFFMGTFFAVNPPLYRDGFVKLFPKDRRQRFVDVLNAMGDSMFAWLNGRFVSMTITGVGTGLGLFLLNVPMSGTIGVLTALLTFVPNVGALIALSLAMTMALSQGPTTVVWVVVVYGALQSIESNVITPIIQQQQTSIPPALLLGFQVILGALTGFLGLLVATPLLAAALVAIKELWIRDTLGDEDV
jgi:predicted PurR-regulated permease PerM